jgi:hypothetical protein
MLLSWLGTDTIKCGAVKVVLLEQTSPLNKMRGHRGRDCIAVGFTTIYAISVHHY